jgi:hypothetical protein
MNLRGIDGMGVECIQLSQDMDRWRVLYGDESSGAGAMEFVNLKKLKLSHYTPRRGLGGEEV